MSRVKVRIGKQAEKCGFRTRKSAQAMMLGTSRSYAKPYKVTGWGNYLYITRPDDKRKGASLGLASRKKIEHVVFGLNSPLEIDVNSISPAQLGNVMEAVDIIAKERRNLDVASIDRNGEPVIVLKRK